MSGLRVGVVCGHFDPARDGVADYTRRLTTHLRERGADPWTVTAHRYATGGEHVIGVTQNWRPSRMPTAARAITRARFDVVHIQFAPSAFGFSRAVGLLPVLLPRELPVFVTLHEYDKYAPRTLRDLRTAGWSMLERAGLGDRETLVLVPRATRLIVTNREHGALLTGRWPRRRSTVSEIPIGPNIEPTPGIDRERVRLEVRRRLGAAPDAPIVVFFGFLHPVKELDRLIEATARLRTTHPGLHLVLCGGMESHSVSARQAARMRERLETIARACGLHGNLTITGYLPDTEVSRLFTAADVAAFPFAEGVTLKSSALLAALAHGVPTVATSPECDAPASEGPVRWVPPRDTDALARALGDVLGDTAYSTRLRESSTRLADAHRWCDIAAAHLRLYDEVLANRDHVTHVGRTSAWPF
jgi:glycosyltransferase involved in cell wall biosynthesis